MTDLHTQDELQAALRASEDGPVVLFKHSSTCMFSAGANRRIATLTADDPPVYRIVVQSARALSNALAEHTGIRHESPQAFVLYQNRVVWHASHSRVTAEAVRDAVSSIA